MVKGIWTGVIAALLIATAAHADHWEKHLGPSEPAREFPASFLPLLPEDSQHATTLGTWADPHVGGWGGSEETCRPPKPPRPPVVFVHGNSVDASFWRTADSGDGTIVNVRDRFLAAGYCPDQLWAISYTGSTGYTTYNDKNTDDIYEFVQAVRSYTRARTVDVVAHSLGVTLVRKTALQHPDLYSQIRTFVAIAGANHGTTSCRGAGTAHVSHVCEETEPGSAWLAELNAAGETPPGPVYLTLYDGSGLTDNFYLAVDAESPRLDGACNHSMPGTPHATLARGDAAVAIYLALLKDGILPECI